MASPLEGIKIALNVTDAGASSVVKKLESSFRGLANATKQLDAQGISKVRSGIKAFDTVGKRNINTIQSQITALQALRNEAQIGSGQFKQLTADIAKYDQELQKAQGRKRRGGRLAGAAKSVGAIAGAGVFGGPEGAIGAAIGAFAGPQGAIIGGAIGAQVGQFRQAVGATAEYQATLTKLRIALKGVTESQGEYQEGLSFIQQTTKDFAVPQEVVTRQFTKLQASVSGAGGNLEDTKTAFNGIVAAVRATGGSLQDVDSALTATAQVFSKGKVSAEELRQQLGERLPGAFTLFAESMGKTPQELDKALEQGQVSLQDFQKFAETLFDKYGETAKTIASSPEAAGDRLKVVLDSLSENIGELLKPVGAAFQETFINIIEFIDMAIGKLKLFFELGATGTKKKVGRLSADVNRLLKLQESRKPLVAAGLIRQADIDQTERDLARKRQELQDAQGLLRELTGFNVAVDAPEKKKGLPGIDPNKPTGSKKIPPSQMVVDLQNKLTDGVGQLTQREQLSVKYAMDRLIILQGTLTGTEKELKLSQLKKKFKEQELALDEKEASAKDRSLAKLTKFEQLEANILAKQQGLTGEQTKQQLLQATINSLTKQYEQDLLTAGMAPAEVTRRIKELAQATVDLKDKSKGFKEQFADGIKSMGDLTGNLANVAVSAFTSMSDKLHEFVVTGKASFSDFAQSLLSDLSRIFIRFAMFKLIGSLIPGLGPFLGLGAKGAVIGGRGGPPTTMPDSVSLMAANGMAFAKNKIVPYAKGGIVGSPTLFKYASGGADRFGLMGEAGPEAIMPLRRGANGKLGVEASGSSIGNITVNVDASGSSVEGDAAQGNQLGQALGIAIQQELMKQQRPGGLLAR